MGLPLGSIGPRSGGFEAGLRCRDGYIALMSGRDEDLGWKIRPYGAGEEIVLSADGRLIRPKNGGFSS